MHILCSFDGTCPCAVLIRAGCTFDSRAPACALRGCLVGARSFVLRLVRRKVPSQPDARHPPCGDVRPQVCAAPIKSFGIIASTVSIHGFDDFIGCWGHSRLCLSAWKPLLLLTAFSLWACCVDLPNAWSLPSRVLERSEPPARSQQDVK